MFIGFTTPFCYYMIQTSMDCHNEGIIISLQEVLKIYTCALIIVRGCSLPVDK